MPEHVRQDCGSNLSFFLFDRRLRVGGHVDAEKVPRALFRLKLALFSEIASTGIESLRFVAEHLDQLSFRERRLANALGELVQEHSRVTAIRGSDHF